MWILYSPTLEQLEWCPLLQSIHDESEARQAKLHAWFALVSGYSLMYSSVEILNMNKLTDM